VVVVGGGVACGGAGTPFSKSCGGTGAAIDSCASRFTQLNPIMHIRK